MRRIFLILCLWAAPAEAGDGAGGGGYLHPPYAGMETRAVKSLSAADIDELRRGGGWGLALAAELNGAPGPRHLLELRGEIGLTSAQVSAVESIFNEMRAEAQTAGARFIAAETALEKAFRAGAPDQSGLRRLIKESADARAELRFIHLSRHLMTLPLLTPGQIADYARLRGYAGGGPCADSPEGHGAGMHGRHGGCG